MEKVLIERIKKGLILGVALSSTMAMSMAWASSDKKMEDAKKHMKEAAKETKEAAKDTAGAAKEAASEASDKMKAAYENFKKYTADNYDKFRERVQNYNWKGIFQEKATVGPTTIKDITLNGHHRAVVVKPGERINVEMIAQLDKSQVKDFQYHRVLVGFKGVGPQKAIGQGIGYLAGTESKEEFALIAPSETGFYEIRFRPVEGYREGEAKKHWLDSNQNEPDASSTIGVVLVKE